MNGPLGQTALSAWMGDSGTFCNSKKNAVVFNFGNEERVHRLYSNLVRLSQGRNKHLVRDIKMLDSGCRPSLKISRFLHFTGLSKTLLQFLVFFQNVAEKCLHLVCYAATSLSCLSCQEYYLRFYGVFCNITLRVKNKIKKIKFIPSSYSLLFHQTATGSTGFFRPKRIICFCYYWHRPNVLSHVTAGHLLISDHQWAMWGLIRSRAVVWVMVEGDRRVLLGRLLYWHIGTLVVESTDRTADSNGTAFSMDENSSVLSATACMGTVVRYCGCDGVSKLTNQQNACSLLYIFPLKSGLHARLPVWSMPSAQNWNYEGRAQIINKIVRNKTKQETVQLIP